VSTTHGHSISKLPLPGSTTGVIISSKRYTAIVNIDKKKRTVTAQGGILLRILVDAVAAAGLALPAAPSWDGATLAGLLRPGSHESSLFSKRPPSTRTSSACASSPPRLHTQGYAKLSQCNSHPNSHRIRNFSIPQNEIHKLSSDDVHSCPNRPTLPCIQLGLPDDAPYRSSLS